MRLVVLGSGTSFGVPQLGCRCPTCTSDDPRDRRTRVGAVVEDGDARLLIDTPPELRLQLLRENITTVDAVLYTHDHADHVHGIDDLRAISVRHGRLPLYGQGDALERIVQRFPYIFDERIQPPPGTSKPELVPMALEAGVEVEIAGMTVVPLVFDHGTMAVYGYRIGRLAYVTDVKTVPDDAVRRLRGVEVLVLNALFERTHPTHLSIPEAIDVARAVGAERTYLTHIPHRSRHVDLLARLPAGIEPAFDGLAVTF